MNFRKNTQIQIICFAITLVFFAFIDGTASGMTLKDLFKDKTSTQKYIYNVFDKAEAGGVENVLKYTTDTFTSAESAGSNKSKKEDMYRQAWFSAFFAAYLAHTSTDEADNALKAKTNSLMKESFSKLEMDSSEYKTLLEKTAKAFDDAMNDPADEPSDSAEIGNNEQAAAPVAEPSNKNKRVSAELKKALDLLEIANTAPAKIEKITGRVAPILELGTPEFQQFAQVMERQALFLMQKTANKKLEELELLNIYSKLWLDGGYDMNATAQDTFTRISPADYNYHMRAGALGAALGGYLGVLYDETRLKQALAQGIVSRKAMQAYFDALVRYIKAVE